MVGKISHLALKTSYFEIVPQADNRSIAYDPYAQQVPVSEGWRESSKFNGRNKIVNIDGKRVSATDEGIKYLLRSKQERQINFYGRISRVTLALFAALFSLGFACFSKSIRRLFTQEKQKIRFAVLLSGVDKSNLPPKVLRGLREIREMERQAQSIGERLSAVPQSITKDAAYHASKRHLKEGVTVSDEMIRKVQNSLRNVLEAREVDGIHLYRSRHSHFVFTLDAVPGLIFKTQLPRTRPLIENDDSMKSRYQKMIHAQGVLDAHQLGLLVIPHARKFKVNVEGNEYELIAEQKLDVMQNRSLQEQYFQKHANSFKEAMRQLAIFICKTGYCDVEWRNNSILNKSVDPQGNRKIALLDIEHMKNVIEGLYGIRRTGLVGLVNEEQASMIEAVAKEYGVNSPTDFNEAFLERKHILENDRKLKAYHDEKRIVQGNEWINCDLNTLGLDLLENGQPRGGRYVESVTLEVVARAIVGEINRLIQKQSLQEGTNQSKRSGLLNVNKKRFMTYTHLGLPPESANRPLTPEEKEQRWFNRVLQALMDRGHIFKFEEEDQLGYRIQA